DVFQELAIGLVKHKASILLAEHARTDRLGISPSFDSSADEKVQVAVAIDITQRQRADAGVVAWNSVGDFVRAQIVGLDATARALAILVVGGTYQEDGLTPDSRARDHRRLVAHRWLARPRSQAGAEAAPAVVQKYGERSPFATADHQVIPTIVVDIAPAEPGTKLAEPFRQ